MFVGYVQGARGEGVCVRPPSVRSQSLGCAGHILVGPGGASGGGRTTPSGAGPGVLLPWRPVSFVWSGTYCCGRGAEGRGHAYAASHESMHHSGHSALRSSCRASRPVLHGQ